MQINPKVQAAGAAGSIAAIVVFIVAQFGVEVPAGVEAELAVLVALVAGYFKTA